MRVISDLDELLYSNVKEDKKSWIRNFFLSGKGNVEEKTLTCEETEKLMKGEINTEYNINFFLPEWF